MIESILEQGLKENESINNLSPRSRAVKESHLKLVEYDCLSASLDMMSIRDASPFAVEPDSLYSLESRIQESGTLKKDYLAQAIDLPVAKKQIENINELDENYKSLLSELIDKNSKIFSSEKDAIKRWKNTSDLNAAEKQRIKINKIDKILGALYSLAGMNHLKVSKSKEFNSYQKQKQSFAKIKHDLDYLNQEIRKKEWNSGNIHSLKKIYSEYFGFWNNLVKESVNSDYLEGKMLSEKLKNDISYAIKNISQIEQENTKLKNESAMFSELYGKLNTHDESEFSLANIAEYKKLKSRLDESRFSKLKSVWFMEEKAGDYESLVKNLKNLINAKLDEKNSDSVDSFIQLKQNFLQISDGDEKERLEYLAGIELELKSLHDAFEVLGNMEYIIHAKDLDEAIQEKKNFCHKELEKKDKENQIAIKLEQERYKSELARKSLKEQEDRNSKLEKTLDEDKKAHREISDRLGQVDAKLDSQSSSYTQLFKKIEDLDSKINSYSFPDDKASLEIEKLRKQMSEYQSNQVKIKESEIEKLSQKIDYLAGLIETSKQSQEETYLFFIEVSKNLGDPISLEVSKLKSAALGKYGGHSYQSRLQKIFDLANQLPITNNKEDIDFLRSFEKSMRNSFEKGDIRDRMSRGRLNYELAKQTLEKVQDYTIKCINRYNEIFDKGKLIDAA